MSGESRNAILLSFSFLLGEDIKHLGSSSHFLLVGALPLPRVELVLGGAIYVVKPLHRPDSWLNFLDLFDMHVENLLTSQFAPLGRLSFLGSSLTSTTACPKFDQFGLRSTLKDDNNARKEVEYLVFMRSMGSSRTKNIQLFLLPPPSSSSATSLGSGSLPTNVLVSKPKIFTAVDDRLIPKNGAFLKWFSELDEIIRGLYYLISTTWGGGSRGTEIGTPLCQPPAKSSKYFLSEWVPANAPQLPQPETPGPSLK
ncbi:hypothetical protein F5051DRAFT_206511 [Lentinula edodes]|nr:hypothetical protein F5051DRAFT_206511 [Lentinula edodes]